MKRTITPALRVSGLAVVMLLFGLGVPLAHAAELKLEAQLIWGTNDEKSPNPKHKPVEPEVRKRLVEDLPLKWKNYFEVNRKAFTVPEKGSKKVEMSDKCAIEVKELDGGKVEVSLFGKAGELVYKRTQALSKGDILALGGNAPDKTAWLVTIKRVE